MSDATYIFSAQDQPYCSTYEQCLKQAKIWLTLMKKEHPERKWEIWVDQWKFTEEELLRL